MRVLIVSPHFPPTNAADHQRVRLVLPHLASRGCAAEVLAVHAANVAAPTDEWLARGLPADVPVHRVEALPLSWGRVPGLGTITFRALGALRRRGDELLRGGRFDLVYFSTTQFGLHVLGPRWARLFGVPFAMDYQDPWVNDYYREHPEVAPPGGRLKFAVSDWLNRRQEPKVLRHCAGITAVSEAYPRQLKERYRWLALNEPGGTGRHGMLAEVMAFPGDVSDLRRVETDGTRQEIFARGDGLSHWVYVGRGGQDMAPAIRGIFGALAIQERAMPGFLKNLRLHFIGTSYAAAGRGQKTIEPLAAEFGLAETVREHPDRLAYSKAMRCLLDADALVVPGSNDPAYTASKIYPYLLARKPLLTVFHENSSVVSLLRRVQGGLTVPFRTGEPEAELAARIHEQWLKNGQYSRAAPLDEAAFAPHTAQAQAARLTEFFARCSKSNP